MTAETGGAAATPDPLLEEFRALVHRTEKEGNAALPYVRAFLDRHPDVCRRFGDLMQSAQLTIIDRATGGQPAVKEAMVRHAAEMEADLAGGPGASALEKVLAGHVTLAWLAESEAEVTAASAATGRTVPLPHADFLDRRRERASKRLESATKNFAVVRKLLLPAPAPIEVATRLGGAAARAARRRDPATEPVGVAN
jgi:hypothetical protein